MGTSEARFWATNLFEVVEQAVPGSDAAIEAAAPSCLAVPRGGVNPRLAAWGLPAELCAAAVNPGFRDPFSPDEDVTLNNPRYWGLMQGKLDWVLLRGAALVVAGTALGNHDYSLSDHKWLTVDVMADGGVADG